MWEDLKKSIWDKTKVKTKTQTWMVTNENLKYDKTQKYKLWQNWNPKFVTKLTNLSLDKTGKPVIWHNSNIDKTQIVIKLRKCNFNIYETQI